MQNKTPEDFKNAALKHNIKTWEIRKCSICRYPLSYHFFVDGASVEVSLDTGCDCVSYMVPYKNSSWQEVADLYNMQTNPGVILDFRRFWGFLS